MNLRRVTIQLDNGLQITLKHLTPKKNNAIYKSYVSTFKDEPRIIFQDIYKATFHFKTAKLYAFCYADAVSLIISLFGDHCQTRARDYFECFVINGHSIHNSSFNGEGEQILTLLKQSVASNISPNLTALLALKTKDEKK